MLQPQIKADLHRPFIDLADSQFMDFYGSALSLTSNLLSCDSDPSPLWVQRQTSPDFREMLVRHLGLDDYSTASASELPESLRSPKWKALCNNIALWCMLSENRKVHTIRTLSMLGFHKDVVALAASELEGNNPAEKNYTYRYFSCIARLRLLRSGNEIQNDTPETLRQELERIYAGVGNDLPQKFLAGLNLLVLNTQLSKDFRRAAELSESVASDIEGIEKICSSSTLYHLARSCFCRGAAMLPQALNDKSRMHELMDLAERFANDACGSGALELLTKENLFSLYESRTKEFIFVEDFDNAERYARKLVQIFPTDSKALLELGEVLLMQGNVSEATQCYTFAAHYGANAAAVAWFMAGHCFEQQGSYIKALHAHSTSQQLDPLGVSSVERMLALSKEKFPAMYQWAKRYSDTLAEM